jgi:outer membrane protein assembly factor BamE (lipoprotein component of BamABCDE complex)
MLKKLLSLAAMALFIASCAGAPAQKTSTAQKPFFDAAVVDTLTPGKATREDVRKALGEPYPDPLKSDNRWTYMYTYQKQIIFLFENGILKEKKWSEEYGIGVDKK